MSIKSKLLKIQTELKAPKGQYNSFGRYKYRSCEDILEAVKPLLNEYEVVLTISDDVVLIGDRFYIKVTATLSDVNSEETISNTALAREELEKKGQDGSQITGTASSYARKYCLNGLFLIDDTKDADTDEYKNQQNPTPKTDTKKKVQDKIDKRKEKEEIKDKTKEALKKKKDILTNLTQGNNENTNKFIEFMKERGLHNEDITCEIADELIVLLSDGGK